MTPPEFTVGEHAVNGGHIEMCVYPELLDQIDALYELDPEAEVGDAAVGQIWASSMLILSTVAFRLWPWVEMQRQQHVCPGGSREQMAKARMWVLDPGLRRPDRDTDGEADCSVSILDSRVLPELCVIFPAKKPTADEWRARIYRELTSVMETLP